MKRMYAEIDKDILQMDQEDMADEIMTLRQEKVQLIYILNRLARAVSGTNVQEIIDALKACEAVIMNLKEWEE